MRSRRLTPRPDQIALLTQGIALPVPAVPPEVIEIVIEAIIDAHAYIKANFPNILATEQEVEITTAIRNRMVNLLDGDPLLRVIICSIGRGEENLSYNGKHIEKRPDFSFWLNVRGMIFPLIGEAKVIGSTRSQSVDSYCNKGILRFVKGEYSWWDRDAIMVAYVFGSKTVSGDLKSFMTLDAAKKRPQYHTKSFPAPRVLNQQNFPCSQHLRKFRYTSGTLGTGKPGTISLWHLWLLST